MFKAPLPLSSPSIGKVGQLEKVSNWSVQLKDVSLSFLAMRLVAISPFFLSLLAGLLAKLRAIFRPDLYSLTMARSDFKDMNHDF